MCMVGLYAGLSSTYLLGKNSQGSCIEFGIFGLFNRQTVSTSGKSDNIIGVFLKIIYA